MPGGRQTRQRLEESWGNVEYKDAESSSSDSDSMLHSNSGSGDEKRHSPLPQTAPKPSSKSSKSSPHLKGSQPSLTPAKQSRRSLTTPLRQSPRSSPALNSPEPSLIMPSMSESVDGSWMKPSPLRNNQVSHRRLHQGYTPAYSPGGTSPRQTRNYRTPQVDKGEGEEPPLVSLKEDRQWLYLEMLCDNIVRPIITYLFSIVSHALQLLKPIFGYVLLFILLLALLSKGANVVTTGIYSALSPLCHLPGLSYLDLPFCGPAHPLQTGHAEFEDLMKVQSVFEDVLQSSVDGASLPLDMKRSESSIRDLKHVVRFSTLPSRSELDVEFQAFIDTARQASYDLTHFNARIGRAVDQILNTNRWTLQVIDGISQKQAVAGGISRLLSHIDPFASFKAAPPTMHEVLFEQYLRHTSAIEEQIQTLIMEAQALLSILENLDQRLDVIAGIATRDGVIARGNRDDLFAHLWTKLGGNRSSVAKLNEQLRLLRDVTMYRKNAWNHVSATVLRLQEIAAGLEDLRERVAAPEVVGVRQEVPLSFHLEYIRLGVERLEGVRGDARRMEGEHYKKILDKGVAEGERLLGDPNPMVRTVYAKTS